MSYTVSLRVTETSMLAAGQHAEFKLDRLPNTEVGRATRQFVDSVLAVLKLDTVPASPIADEGDEVQLLELGTRGEPSEELSVLALPTGARRHEFSGPHFVNAIRLSSTASTPARGIYLPEPIAAEGGDTVHVAVSPDGRTAVVQHSTEGTLAGRLARAMFMREGTPDQDLIDLAAIARMVLDDVYKLAERQHYTLNPDRVTQDVSALLWKIDQQLKTPGVQLDSLAQWSGLLRDGLTADEVRRWAEGARNLIGHLDAELTSHGMWPPDTDLPSPENRLSGLAALLDRLPVSGDAAAEGEDWGSGPLHLVLDPHEPGDNTAVISVYADGDGPSVSLDAETLRNVAATLLGRADLLDAAAEFWKDPHDEVKGTVSWPEVYDPEVSHASVSCCGRIECIDAAADWVKASTGHLGQWTVHAEKGR